MRSFKRLAATFGLMAGLGGGLAAQEAVEASGQNCTWIASPDEVRSKAERIKRDAYERTLAFSRAMSASSVGRQSVSAGQVPRRNFIDDEIFGKLQSAGMPSAALSTDEEFLRRVTLDLTGRIPSAEDIRTFVANQDPDKRDAVIEKLLWSPEFVDKWTVWLGDILQNARAAQNRSQQTEGRNRLYEWIRWSIQDGKSWRDVALEMVNGLGNNYLNEGVGANFILRGTAPMGPAQDTYDLLMVKTATAFLGMNHYDCLMCHDGKYHLDQVSSWGAKAKRLEAQRMSAHFSRITIAGYPGNDPANFFTNSTTITNRAAGTYDLNTNFGNRPNRVAVMIDGRSTVNLTPVYRDGKAAAGDWRESLVKSMIADPMFARNYANRVWKAMFNLGLAEPVDQLDPDRLDPAAPPSGAWTLQASHPELLEMLSKWCREGDFNLRDTLRLIAQSNAYQLSARYDANWDITKAAMFARHIPRRMEAEEVHDALVKATQVFPAYAVSGWGDRMTWAMQLPEPVEPLSDGTAAAFMNSFNRGNRDTLQRNQSGSILMWMNIMNSSVVNNRVRTTGATASPYLVAMTKVASNDQVIEDMFLTFISRKPTEYERGVAQKFLQKATTAALRATAIEDLAWALVNKTDFLFSY
ncbi:MAG: DUF1549 domain-containing protein [Acidobacteria bacterium]|nr:DUF1549 domain-containing protein [Acidobacteriota bacterium]